jgi:hypothetical protein
MGTRQNAQHLLRIMVEGGRDVYLDLPERSGLNRQRFHHAVQYLESVGKVRLGHLPGGRPTVALMRPA